MAALATGLCEHKDIRFRWENNAECPLDWQDVFPDGIPGVTFENGSPVGRCTGWSAVFTGLTPSHPTAPFISLVMDHMAGTAEQRPPMAVFIRFFRTPGVRMQNFVSHILSCADRKEQNHVFLMADSRRGEITEHLRNNGVTAVQPQSPELARDLGRTPEGTVLFLSDWKTLLGSRWIVAGETPSAVLFPARAEGIPVL